MPLHFQLGRVPAGNSSLSYLSTYELDFLKIDRAFVSEIGSNRVSNPLLFNIIEIGRSQGLQMIAEGVETEEQRDVLVEAGVHLAQGGSLASLCLSTIFEISYATIARHLKTMLSFRDIASTCNAPHPRWNVLLHNLKG